jgi:hypothetical protein
MTPEDYRHQNSPSKNNNMSDRALARESWIVVSPGSVVSDVHRPSLDNNSVRLVRPPPLLAPHSEESRSPLPLQEFGSRTSSAGSIPQGASPPTVVTPSNPNYKLPLATLPDGINITRDRPHEPPSILVPTTPREAIGHIDMSQPHPNHDRERDVLRRKNRGSGMLVGMFNHEQRPSLDDLESIHSNHVQEKAQEKVIILCLWT